MVLFIFSRLFLIFNFKPKYDKCDGPEWTQLKQISIQPVYLYHKCRAGGFQSIALCT
jgi:hypothetical protein